ncbi:MAG: phosphodiester glycosidase family protein [FCB group bacterium]|nr:phosphodiester glycosidase family protein [FCB group bacterium]
MLNRTKLTIIAICGLFLLSSCSSNTGPTVFHLTWIPIDSLNQSLPANIRVYFGEDTNIPVRAWMVKVIPDPVTDIDVIIAPDNDNRQTPEEIYQWSMADVVINGGYFLMDKNPTEHVGLVLSDGAILEHALRSVLRNNERYYITRGALGFDSTGKMDVAWVSEKDGVLYQWDQPLENSEDKPALLPDYTQAHQWNVSNALQAGPVLISDGQIDIPVDEEVFFKTSIPKVHPRTAAGYRSDGTQIYMVVDGRQSVSRGVWLEELAGLFMDEGCVEAINLDGGGSSALVVNGILLNRPAGSQTQREVMTAIIIRNDHE